MAKRYRWAGWAFALMALTSLANAAWFWLNAIQVELSVFLLGFALPILALAARRSLANAALLERDAREGRAEHFADQVAGDATSVWRRELRVLPHSRLPLRRDGRPLGPRYRVQTKSVAPPPQSCFTVEIPRHVGVVDPKGRPIKRRHLSQEERVEMQEQVEEIRAIPLSFVVFLTYLAVGSAGATLFSDQLGWTIYFWLQFSVFAHLLVLTLRRFLARYMSAAKLQHDLRLGWVFCIMNAPSEQPGRYEEVQEEVLGHAKRPWSRLGQPATWRTRAEGAVSWQ